MAEWRPVPDDYYSTFYEVSDEGNLRRSVPGKGTAIHRIIKARLAPASHYYQVVLSRDALTRTFYVHRLVALAFLGLPPRLTDEVNHRDGDKSNNAVANLEWVTKRRNMEHAAFAGLTAKGEGHGRHKLTAEEVAAIRISTGTQKAIAQRFGIGQSQVCRIRTGKNWSTAAQVPATPL